MVIDEVLRNLELANQFEQNARRLLDGGNKGPRWVDVYNRCLAEAKRVRGLAREIARSRGAATTVVETAMHKAAGHRPRKINFEKITVGRILHLVAIIQSSSPGTARLKRASLRMKEIVGVLEGTSAIGQILWWAEDVSPIPPGRPAEVLNEIRSSGRVLPFGRTQDNRYYSSNPSRRASDSVNPPA